MPKSISEETPCFMASVNNNLSLTSKNDGTLLPYLRCFLARKTRKSKKEYNHGNDIIALVITSQLVMLGKQGCNRVLKRPAPRVIGKDSPWTGH